MYGVQEAKVCHNTCIHESKASSLCSLMRAALCADAQREPHLSVYASNVSCAIIPPLFRGIDVRRALNIRFC